MPRVLTFLLLLLLATAQAGDTTTQDERWYLVEIVVFERLGNMPDPAVLQQTRPEFDDTGSVPLAEPAPAWRRPYQRHSAYHLAEARRRLGAHPDYRVLLHEGWLLSSLAAARPVQLGWPETTATPVQAQGLVRTRITRYLDVDVDFAWFPFARDSAQGEVHGRIRQTRRIQLNQLHYFDHPSFGVLLQASPVES